MFHCTSGRITIFSMSSLSLKLNYHQFICTTKHPSYAIFLGYTWAEEYIWNGFRHFDHHQINQEPQECPFVFFKVIWYLQLNTPSMLCLWDPQGTHNIFIMVLYIFVTIRITRNIQSFLTATPPQSTCLPCSLQSNGT